MYDFSRRMTAESGPNQLWERRTERVFAYGPNIIVNCRSWFRYDEDRVGALAWASARGDSRKPKSQPRPRN